MKHMLCVAVFLACTGCQSLWREHYEPKSAVTSETMAVTTLDFGQKAPPFSPEVWVIPRERTPSASTWTLICTEDVEARGMKPVLLRLASVQKQYGGRLEVVGVRGTRDASMPRLSCGFAVAEISKEIDADWIKPNYWTVTSYPWLYVVHDGKIQWAGHALTLSDGLIDDMLAGRYLAAERARVRTVERARLAGLINLRESITEDLYNEDWDGAFAKIDAYLARLEPNDQVVRGVARRMVTGWGGRGEWTTDSSGKSTRRQVSKGYDESRATQLQKEVSEKCESLNRLLARKKWPEASALIEELRRESDADDDVLFPFDFILATAESAVAYGRDGQSGGRLYLQRDVQLHPDDPDHAGMAVVLILANEKNFTKSNAPLIREWSNTVIRLRPGSAQADHATFNLIMAEAAESESKAKCVESLSALAASTKYSEVKANCERVLAQLR